MVHEYVEQRRSSNQSADQIVDPMYHVVYRTSGKLEKEYPLTGKFLCSWIDKKKFNFRRKKKKKIRFLALNKTLVEMRGESSGVPYVIYPKLLLVVDYSMYK